MTLPDLAQVSYEQLTTDHKQQRKAAAAEVAALKKQMTKKNKKTIQTQINEVNSRVNTKLQKEVSQWKTLHKDEIATSSATASHNEVPDLENNDELTPEDLLKLTVQDTEPVPVAAAAPQTRQPKRNRQKERLAKREAMLKEVRDQAAKESEGVADLGKLELDKMNPKLIDAGLQVVDILPDGNCLFNSIRDQLQYHMNIEKSVQDLRELSSEYIMANAETFEPFLFEKSMEGYSIAEYCTKLVTETMWGSDIEIMALSNVFDCQIEVFVAEGANLVFNEDKKEAPRLAIGFYKHSFGLGEHYNSLR